MIVTGKMPYFPACEFVGFSPSASSLARACELAGGRAEGNSQLGGLDGFFIKILGFHVPVFLTHSISW